MPLCLLSIHVDDATVDVVLPAAHPVAGLLPDVVALAGRPAAIGVTRWRLLRMSGVPVDEYLTLAENGVRDGDALLLVSDVPSPPLRRPWDTARAVTTAAIPPAVHLDVGAGAVAVGLMALCWAGSEAEHRWVYLGIAAVLACVATGRALTTLRSTTRLAAVAGCASTGFLVVPPGVVAGSVLVASAAAGTVAAVLIRLRGPAPALVAAASFSSLTVVAAAAATAWSIPPATAGAVLAVAALAGLGVSGRLAVLGAGLTPGRDGTEAAALRGHAVLDGLVAGCAGAVAAGATVVAAMAVDAPALALTIALAVVLLLRVRAHVDPVRRLVLTVCGSICGAASLIITVSAFPAIAPWSAALVAAAGLAVGPAHQISPVASRCIDAAGYVAIAAVVPLACWVGGLYAAARGWHLP